MQRYQNLGVDFNQIMRDVYNLFLAAVYQVHPANHRVDPIVPGDAHGLLNGIDGPGMAASQQNNQPFFGV